jgi:hypothetical protein
MTLQLPQTLARVSVPDADLLVITPAYDEACVVAELNAREAPVMTFEFADALPGLNVPKLDQSIARGAGDLFSTNCNSTHWPPVTMQLAKESQRIAVPDTDGSVLRTCYDILVAKTNVQNSSSVVR